MTPDILLAFVVPAVTAVLFVSNAVTSIIAIRVLGYGVEWSGLMGRIIRPVRRLADSGKKRLMALVYTII
ncbi:hypothetical protein AMJ86_04910 [bacterium SM23_57]|nr:MAG: hypothetical protein AMJ86_04910 [bacterium SM23_57]